MIYLTGASNSLAKTKENPQTDASRSLGGYISSTPVPNANLNALFDMISSYTIEKKQKETLAFGLINQFDKAVKNVELKIISNENNIASFRVAAVAVNSDNYCMESIVNRYSEPMLAEFHDASFYRASVDIEIKQFASVEEEIALLPFGINLTVKKNGWDGTWEAFEEAFSNDENYCIRRLSERVYRISRRDEKVIEHQLKCSYVSTEGFRAEFLGEFGNKINNTVLISDKIEPNEAVGLWIQRYIKRSEYPTNEEILEDYKKHVVTENIEEVEIILSYDLSD